LIKKYRENVNFTPTPFLPYLPSTVFPTGPSKVGLPIGLQAVSVQYRDHRTIEFARLIARESGGFVALPNYSNTADNR
jgi:Asp-tRNA(Asn)/Glu-tRNA(Gln) amidotransferase A subunit family amidase